MSSELALSELAECEAVIERGLNTFVEVGTALLTIRDKKLYREDFEKFVTFEEYCEKRWGFSDERARLLMNGAKVVQNLKTPTNVGVLPTNEAQARPLTALKEPEQQQKVWNAAVEEAKSEQKPVTAKHVQTAVDQFFASGASEEESAPPPSDDDAPQPPARAVTTVRFEPLPDHTFAGVTPLVARSESKSAPSFNRTNENVEWALWTWNPVTGCLHDCAYCYARDIANRFYEQKFVPTFHPDRLAAPRCMKAPDLEKIMQPFNPSGCTGGIGEKNVFVCSMADLFGKWVPQEWIDAVFAEVKAAPQWNFLFLTKFPQRLAELEWPENAWVGTTVDTQARVKIAERSFRGVKAGVKWLSVEPMMERLDFSSLSMFDWVVMGGSSKSSQTPELFPPIEWTFHLWEQARRAGCKVYMKTNLGVRNEIRHREYPGQVQT